MGAFRIGNIFRVHSFCKLLLGTSAKVSRFRSPFVGAEPYQMEGLNPSTFQSVPRTERAPIRPLKAETTRTHPTTRNTPQTRFRKHPHPHGDRDRPTSPAYIPGEIGATDAQTIDKQYAPAPTCNSTRTRLSGW